MKILVYVAGVIGSIFASKLLQAKNNVTILARNKRYNEILKNGIVLYNPKTQLTETTKIKVVNRLLEDMVYDYIFVVMQKTQVSKVLDVLAKNKSPNIVFAVNTASGYEEWTQAVGSERLMLEFPSSAGGESKGGIVSYFIGKGFMHIFQTTTFGETTGKKTKRIAKLVSMFSKTKIPSTSCSNMDAWQKTNATVVTCIANSLYAYDCDNKKLGNSQHSIKEMLYAIREGGSVLKTLGIPTTPYKLNFFYLPIPLITFVFQIFMNTQLAEITMAKHCINAKHEMIALQHEFDLLIKNSEYKTPYIDFLKKNLI